MAFLPMVSTLPDSLRRAVTGAGSRISRTARMGNVSRPRADDGTTKIWDAATGQELSHYRDTRVEFLASPLARMARASRRAVAMAPCGSICYGLKIWSRWRKVA